MTREEAKKIFLNRGFVEVDGGTIFDGDKWRQACVVISDFLEGMPVWIPVSERLPEKEMNCLVTDSLGKVHKVTFYHSLDGRESYFSGCYCVMAWMPLPEPYEPQESFESCKGCQNICVMYDPDMKGCEDKSGRKDG